MIFGDLRNRAYLRRGVRALESIAESLRTISTIEADKHANLKPLPRPTEFGEFNLEEAEKRWAEQQAEDNVERG